MSIDFSNPGARVGWTESSKLLPGVSIWNLANLPLDEMIAELKRRGFHTLVYARESGQPPFAFPYPRAFVEMIEEGGHKLKGRWCAMRCMVTRNESVMFFEHEDDALLAAMAL